MPDINESPIIGLVANNIKDLFDSEPFARAHDYTSMIGRNYVQSIYSAGARVVPIIYDAPWEEIEYLLDRINGAVYMGGATNPHGYLKSRKIYEYIKNRNYQGHHIPILGICLGA